MMVNGRLELKFDEINMQVLVIKGHAFVYIFREVDLGRFSADFVVCVNMVPEYDEP